MGLRNCAPLGLGVLFVRLPRAGALGYRIVPRWGCAVGGRMTTESRNSPAGLTACVAFSAPATCWAGECGEMGGPSAGRIDVNEIRGDVLHATARPGSFRITFAPTGQYFDSPGRQPWVGSNRPYRAPTGRNSKFNWAVTYHNLSPTFCSTSSSAPIRKNTPSKCHVPG
jgi:hypothetical protein